jgi:hypothetical protein
LWRIFGRPGLQQKQTLGQFGPVRALSDIVLDAICMLADLSPNLYDTFLANVQISIPSNTPKIHPGGA